MVALSEKKSPNDKLKFVSKVGGDKVLTFSSALKQKIKTIILQK
jgi:hypothetical protein